MSALRAVVLDLDGLMIDTEGASRDAWRQALGEAGFGITDERYLELVGITIADVRKKMAGWYGSAFPFDLILKRKLELMDAQIAEAGIPLKPGLPEFLDAVDSICLAKAVASSTNRDRMIRKLERAGLAGRFPVAVGGDEVAHGKPAPDIFQEAARRLGIPPEDCLALEDSDAGALAAARAGMRVVIIPDMKQPSPEAARLAWRVLPDLAWAAGLLEEILRGTVGRGES